MTIQDVPVYELDKKEVECSSCGEIRLETEDVFIKDMDLSYPFCSLKCIQEQIETDKYYRKLMIANG